MGGLLISVMTKMGKISNIKDKWISQNILEAPLILHTKLENPIKPVARTRGWFQCLPPNWSHAWQLVLEDFRLLMSTRM